MSYRFFPIDNEDVDIMFSRDIDSRINERDIWTMYEFIKSEYTFHIVRDHYYHKSKIMGGMFGIKSSAGLNMRKIWDEWYNNQEVGYGTDEFFLQMCIYPLIQNNVLIHSNIFGFLGEKLEHIDYPLINDTDFIGNVVEFNDINEQYYVFKYSNYPFLEQFKFLRSQEQWSLLLKISENIDIMKININDRRIILNDLYMANYYCNQFEECIKIFTLFKIHNIIVDEALIYNSSFLIYKLNKTIIGTTDINRKPNENEIVIIYGNFHHSFDNLPIDNIIYRHPFYFNYVNHHVVEFHESFSNIDKIYILNLIDRKDRYLEILVELCKIGVPLDRIYHYKASKEVITGNKKIDIYYGAGKNHIDVIKHFIDNNYNNCLILEDDVTFTSNIEQHRNDLKIFFNRKYDFDICFITASKYGEIKNYDDLLCLSYQPCTTSSGYIINKNSAQKILDILEEGNKKLLETYDDLTYTCDRYWQKLQKDNKFFLFKNKFGYQRPNYSSITQQINCNFD
jgi:hypothetical protein